MRPSLATLVLSAVLAGMLPQMADAQGQTPAALPPLRCAVDGTFAPHALPRSCCRPH